MKIYFHKQFEKRFEKLDPKIKKQFIKRLKLFNQNPFHFQLNNHALKGRFENYRSINITGDWRAIYKQTGDNAIEFNVIGTHDDLYF